MQKKIAKTVKKVKKEIEKVDSFTEIYIKKKSEIMDLFIEFLEICENFEFIKFIKKCRTWNNSVVYFHKL